MAPNTAKFMATAFWDSSGVLLRNYRHWRTVNTNV